MKMKNMRRIACTLLVLVIVCFTGAEAGVRSGGRELIPLGKTVGVEINAGGLLITALTTVESKEGTLCPARKAGLASGDLIVAINGIATPDIRSFAEILSAEGEKSAKLSVIRSGIAFETDVLPVCDLEGDIHIGIMVKDTVEGIGTMTYYDPQEQIFAALGHGINDSGILMPLWHGRITRASVTAAVKGERGAPGHLEGDFDLSSNLGEIRSNTECGIFGGPLNEDLFKGSGPVPVASISQVECGAAVIYANVYGEEVREYGVEIVKINGDAKDSYKDLLIRVTDPELLEMTGGIVQGMSGSPIIQNGMIIGAVTHVLVDDPTRGYAISIEKMLEAGGSAFENAA